MNRFSSRVAVLSAAFLLVAGMSDATTVTFGPDINPADAGDCTFACTARLQQDYSAAAFGASPVTITDVQFFTGGGTDPGNTYTLTLSVNPSGPSLSNIFANNLVLNTQTFAGLTLGSVAAGTIDFAGSYNYDPSQGDLVVDIQSNNPNPNFNFYELFTTTDSVNRAYSFDDYSDANNGGGVNTGYGIATVFVDEPAPEPTSLAILGAGLAGLGFIRRRRRA